MLYATIAPLKPRGTLPNPHLADAFDHGRTIGSAAANHIGQRGCAHPVPDSRTEAALSRTPAPRIREGVGDVRSLLLGRTTERQKVRFFSFTKLAPELPGVLLMEIRQYPSIHQFWRPRAGTIMHVKSLNHLSKLNCRRLMHSPHSSTITTCNNGTGAHDHAPRRDRWNRLRL